MLLIKNTHVADATANRAVEEAAPVTPVHETQTHLEPLTFSSTLGPTPLPSTTLTLSLRQLQFDENVALCAMVDRTNQVLLLTP